MSRELLEDRFSLGFTCHDMSISTFKGIVNRFSDYIHDIYFSPPYGRLFHTRSRIGDSLKPRLNVEQKMFDALRELSDNGFKLNLALNTEGPEHDEVIAAGERVLDKLPVDMVTTLNEYVDDIQELAPDLTYRCSYNEGVKTPEEAREICEAGKFEYIVLGNSAIRDRKLWEVINDSGCDVVHMLNNGCSFRCRHYCSSPAVKRCEDQFYETMNKPGYDVNRLYAEQSIFPWELHEYLVDEDLIKYFKLSSRPSTAETLKAILFTYINGKTEAYANTNPGNYYIWGRLGHFSDFLGELDHDRLCKLKRKLWEGSLQNSYELFGPYENSKSGSTD